MMISRLLLFSLLFSASFCLYGKNSEVIELTEQNFQSLVLNSQEVWMVEFYAPWCGHCKNLVPEWIKAAKALKGVVKVGAIDMDVHPSIGSRYGVEGFPTIKRFDAGKPVNYNGERSAKAISEFALRGVSGLVSERLGGKPTGGSSAPPTGGSGGVDDSDVVKLNSQNFDQLVLNSKDVWLVEFFAPWCGHCKRLAPVWADVATKLKGQVKVGAVDATVDQQLGSRYNIRGYPTIKAFLPNDKNPVDFEGGRDAESIISYALGLAEQFAKPVEVSELLNDQTFDNECKKKGLCVLAFLPHILDSSAAERNKYISVLQSGAQKFRKTAINWFWLEAGSQPDFEEKLGVGGFGYPAVVAVSAKKMVSSTMRRAFTEEGLNNFISGLQTGKEPTYAVKLLPVLKTVDPWDGKDGQPPAE